ncbi:unnamed protein product [Effrenium voratum]|nr:unnamed protein product [Effrenium voratum]
MHWHARTVSRQNQHGNTALHEATISGAKDVAWLIVENGGERSVRIKNKEGKTPLDIARDRGREEFVTWPCLSERARCQRRAARSSIRRRRK